MTKPPAASARLVAPDILARARAGDRASFAQLVEQSYPRALRFATHMLGDARDAEEAVQDTFVRVHRHLARFNDDAAFEPWFFRILGNRCRTLAKTRRRHDPLVFDEQLAEHHAVAPADLPDDHFARELQRALATLPPTQREAFLLRHVDDMDYDEMTTITGAQGSTLRMRVKRAIDTLREQLTPARHTDAIAHDAIAHDASRHGTRTVRDLGAPRSS
ncbi:MAG: RNA polymerase sigma factor [Gemmatimonadaceae bacterium]|nr:RNA polymerase sigma factor [Gemmatimonadaceae bacterium]